MKYFEMSKADWEAHQRKHGFSIQQDPVIKTVNKISREKGMNQTEREFSMILESRKREGKIVRWAYEAITLRWGGLRYTPDFYVLGAQSSQSDGGEGWNEFYQTLFIETKGAFIYDDALVKFKAAKAHWQEFEFQLWQKTQQGWAQLI